ncbi:MAG: propanediol utilization protein [Paracoccaceae bacterium]
MMRRETRVAGHFGEFMQGRIGPDGPVALISIPCPVLTLRARLDPAADFAMDGQSSAIVSQQRAGDFLNSLGMALRGRVTLDPDMPVGGGAGASTAALVALARLAGWSGAPELLARACVESEGATDPLMFEASESLLWASRQGRILRELGSIPRLEVVGGFFGPEERTDADDTAFPDIEDLLDPWGAATRAQDALALAKLSAVAARRTLSLRGPAGDPTEALTEALSAAGFAIAHTGSARALLFLPGQVPNEAETALAQCGYRQTVRFSVGGGR